MTTIDLPRLELSFLGLATDADVDRFLRVLPGAVADLREMADLDAQAIERETRR